MSLLAVDIGNAHTVLGLLDTAADQDGPGEVVAHWRVSTDERRTADEWAVLVRGLLAGADEPRGTPEGIVVCATVPSVLHEWREMLSRHFSHLRTLVVEAGVRTGIAVLTDNPREVGTDRIVNAIAAAHRFGGPTIVVDFGATATTFDVVNAAGAYVGGAISPGLEISLAALGRRGAQLREVELVRPRTVIARNTVEALQSGIVFGVAAQVEGLVARMVTELGRGTGAAGAAGAVRGEPALHVVATGYLADVVLDECTCFTDHVESLTLEGLSLVFARHR